MCKRKRPPRFLLMAVIYVGDDLLSHALSRTVQSARRGLTSVFGMGTGISHPVKSPASLTWTQYSAPLGPRRNSKVTQDLVRRSCKEHSPNGRRSLTTE